MAKIKESLSIKILIIAVITLVLLIPALFIKNLIRERESRRDGTLLEISGKWGREQNITGPFISIPFRKYFLDSLGQRKYYVSQYHILPDELNIIGEIVPEIRYRGIYETVLYTSKLKIQSNINVIEKMQLDSNEYEILWKKAEVNFGISDLKGIKEIVAFNLNEDSIDPVPGLSNTNIIEQGLSAKIESMPDEINIELEIELNGSEGISFHPVGEVTQIELKGPWSNPSFDGNYLPYHREINSSSFLAKWKVLHLNRNYPQNWEGNKFGIGNSEFGVELLLPVDIYKKTERVVKYALLFIAITFLGFFFSEMVGKKKIHPIQYLLIGFSILLFYTLLLSISEHMNFDFAYLISSVMVVGLIGLYSSSILAGKIFGVYISVILVILYTYYYILLQLQDYALLIGSIGLFIILSLFMYFTRKINWYKVETTDSEKG